MNAAPPNDTRAASSLPPLPEETRATLAGLRIGCVGYLNARPLIAPYSGPVHFDHPAPLARSLVEGKLDAALVPVFEALRNPTFPIVDGVAIAADGPVWSVFVAWRKSLRDIVLDPASLTSANLCRVLIERANFHPGGGIIPEDTARLLIGNQAIEFRRIHGESYRYLDLAEEWKKRTGLPFVFAVWLLRPELPDPEAAAEAFRQVAIVGREAIPRLAAREPDPAFTRRYLGEHLSYDLGEAEKEGLAFYRQLLVLNSRLPSAREPLQWV